MASREHEDDAISDIEGSSLFSDGDSEIIDSPADGYFSQRSHPQQMYVQNDSSSKAQEATSSSSRPQHAQYLPSSSYPAVWATEHAPLLDAGPAPPDYYAATADRRSSGGNDAHLNTSTGTPTYGSISEEHENGTIQTPRVLLQAGFFGQNRTPQSMLDPAQNVDEESQTTIAVKKEPGRGWRRRFHTRGCLTVLIVAVTITAVLVLGLSGSHDNNKINTPEYNSPIPLPSPAPSPTPAPTQPVDGGDENPHYPHDTLPTHPALPGCSYNTFSNSWRYDFDNISNFTFTEALSSPSFQYSLGGTVWVRPAPDDQIPAVRVTVSFVTSAGVNILNPRPILTHDSIRLEAPELETTTPLGYRACIDAGIAIDVKKGVTLENWMLDTSTFNILVLAQLFDLPDASDRLKISDTSTFTSKSGKVNAEYWSSRKTIIKTISSSVHGAFALRDLVDITTRSGSITVDISPKTADEDKPLPAEFKATAKSGSIRAVFPIRYELPDRDYQTTVNSMSGSISGDYIHGTYSSFRSTSGSVTTTLLPFNASQNSSLTTDVTNGSTNLEILSPYDGGLLKHMSAKHDSSHGSGSIRLRYPDEWEGSFAARTTSGSVFVHGHGVETDGSGFLGFLGSKKISGWKGTGDSFLDVVARSGSVDVRFGSETFF